MGCQIFLQLSAGLSKSIVCSDSWVISFSAAALRRIMGCLVYGPQSTAILVVGGQHVLREGLEIAFRGSGSGSAEQQAPLTETESCSQSSGKSGPRPSTPCSSNYSKP